MTAAHRPDPRHLASAGWTEDDLAWEDLQERGAEAWRDGDVDLAASLWAQALRLARTAFAANDPRLATSLANHTAGLAHGAGDTRTESLLHEALAVWDGSGPWVAALPPDRRSRSSTYHVRLETRYRGGYDRFARERHAAIVAEGRSALHARLFGGEAPDNLDRWRTERPDGYTGTRKLLAAALLIAPHHGTARP
jgi:hypothetical protein